MTVRAPFIVQDEIAQAFSHAAQAYDAHAFVQQEIGQRLLQRLALVPDLSDPILDLGSGTGYLTQQLQQQFPNAPIVGIDLAFGMCHYARHRLRSKLKLPRPEYLCANGVALPFKRDSMAMIFSNLTLQWCFPLSDVMQEIFRVAKPGAECFFATLGPQTLYELRESFGAVDLHTHVNDFADLITVGNALQSAGFIEPVVDREIITVTYRDVRSLMKTLKATGAHNKSSDRLKGCLSSQRWHKLLKAYEKFKLPDGRYPATFEVIFGHAIKMRQPLYRQNDNGVVHIPGENIPRLNRVG